MLSRLIGAVLTLTLSFALLVGTLSYLSKQENPNPDNTETPPLTFTTESVESATVELATELTSKGTLTLGSYTKIRLDNDTTLSVESVDFDTHGLLTAATLDLKSGRIWLANNIWGTKITIQDDFFSAVSRGGTMIFKSYNNDNAKHFTQIATISGSIQIKAVKNPTVQATLLTAGELATLTPDTVDDLAIADSFERQKKWQELTTTDLTAFEFFEQANQELDVRFLNHLVSQQRTTQHTETQATWFKKIRQQLTFLPSATANFWRTEAINLLDTVIAQPSKIRWAELANYLADPDFGGRQELEAVIRAELPYARLQAHTQLADDNLALLNKLATVETELAKLIKTEPLPKALALEHELNLAINLLKNHPAAADESLAMLAKSISNIDDLEITDSIILGSALLAFFKQAPDEITLHLVDAYHKLNSIREKEPTALATTLSDQVRLVQLLITTDQRNIAPLATHELEKLLETGKQHLTAEQFIRLTDIGTDLSSRVAYLQTLEVKAKFHESAYQTWTEIQTQEKIRTDKTAELAKKIADRKAEKAKLTAELNGDTPNTDPTKKTDPNPAKIDDQPTKNVNPVEIIYNQDDGKVARPGSLVEWVKKIAIPKPTIEKTDIPVETNYDPNDGKIARPLLDFSLEIEALN